MRYLAVDIGASSGRHIVGELVSGKLLLEEVYRFPNGAITKNGSLIWDVDRLYENVVAGLKRAHELGKTPDVIGIDTWAVDYALLDKDNKRIGDVACYRDDRTGKAIEYVHGKIPFEKLYEKTGIQFQPFNTVYQLCADLLSGKLDNACRMLMLPDYLQYLLTGEMRQEYTNATSTGLVNASTHDWDQEILSQLGLPARLFGTLSQPSTKIGKLSDDIVRQVGFCAEVVLPATHDTASAVLAAPLDGQTPYISSGTWSLLGIEQDFAHTDEVSRKNNYSNEGSIGYGFRYQKNIMGLWLMQSVRRELGSPSFPDMAAWARETRSVGLVDVNDERFLSPKSMVAEIKAATKKDLTDAEVIRVVYDSLADSYRVAIDALEKTLGARFSTLNIIGGGSRDVLLNELTEKATGKTVIAGPVEATAIGNLVMQMIGTGEIADIRAARNIIKQSF